MIEDLGKKRSLVIPKWIGFHRAVNSKELSIPRKTPLSINSFTVEQARQHLDEFSKNPSTYLASDLMGAAIVIDDFDTAAQMAKYVLERKGVKAPTIKLAEKVLISYDEENTSDAQLGIDVKIAYIRKSLINAPHDSISWMELARLYTIKGLKQKARKAAIVSLTISPFNRYIVRSGVRFFIHIGEYDTALHYTKKALSAVYDPWIKAIEVSLAQKLKKSLEKVKKILPNNPSYAELFHFSELFESCGMLELESGNKKKAKGIFKTAWKNPSESVIRHGEWVIRNKFPGLKDNVDLNFQNSYEALSFHFFYNLDFVKAIENTIQWELEEPYSASPYILGSHVYDLSDDYNSAAESARRGLSANPQHFSLTNNLCYSLAMAGQLEEAGELLKNIGSHISDDKRPFYDATCGLLEFKKGNIELGRHLYAKSIKQCKKIGSIEYQAKAVLNLAIAECGQETRECINIGSTVLKQTKNVIDPTIHILRRKLNQKLEMVEKPGR